MIYVIAGQLKGLTAKNIAERTRAVIGLLKKFAIRVLENSEINFATNAMLLIAGVSSGSDQKHSVEQNSISQSNYNVFLSGRYNTGTVVFLQHEVSMIDVFLTA